MTPVTHAGVTRLAKPRRPIPGESAEIERLSAMLTAVLSELTIVRERLDTMERLSARAGVINLDDIEAFEPTAEETKARDAIRQRQIAKVFRILRDDAERQANSLERRRKPEDSEADQIIAAEVA
jgi:hypothetical protein